MPSPIPCRSLGLVLMASCCRGVPCAPAVGAAPSRKALSEDERDCSAGILRERETAYQATGRSEALPLMAITLANIEVPLPLVRTGRT